MIADRVAAKSGAEWKAEKRWQAELTRMGQCWLCKPQAYMNLSGHAVASVAAYYKILPEAVLIVLDDVAIPLGKLRLRAGGGPGGHNGLRSVIEHIGTDQVPRLRVGIGGAPGHEMVDHVLGRFHPDEKDSLVETLERAVAALECAQTDGLPAAMNAFN